MADTVETTIPLSVTSTRHFTDAQKAKLQKATKDFESIFVQMMLKSMRSAQGEEGAEGSEFGGESYGGDTLKSMLDTELSKHVGRQGKLGIAEALYKKLTGESLPGLAVQSGAAMYAELEKSKRKKNVHEAANTPTASNVAGRAASAVPDATAPASLRLESPGSASEPIHAMRIDEIGSAVIQKWVIPELFAEKSAQPADVVQQSSVTADNTSRKSTPTAPPQGEAALPTPVAEIQGAQAPVVELPPTPRHAKGAPVTMISSTTRVAARQDASHARLVSGSGAAGSLAMMSAAIDRVKSYNAIIAKTADTVGVDANLLRAMIVEESGAKRHARSSSNAKGLMQLIDTTAHSMGVKNVWDPHQNIEGGARYLKQQLDKFDGNVSLALASYNAGPGNVERYGGIPPFKETRNYVRRVMNLYNAFQSSETTSNEVTE